ncbi:MAG: hypothetical protein IPI73_03895 [Betaproteobacteria bacterium]|nr:hypothetical protein [Betaproteobacteria bacterium]
MIALPALALTLVMGVARFPNATTGDYMTVSAYAGIGVQAWAHLDRRRWPGRVGAAGAAISVIFYLWVFRALRGRAPVASLVAAIGVASSRARCSRCRRPRPADFQRATGAGGTLAASACCPPTSSSPRSH